MDNDVTDIIEDMAQSLEDWVMEKRETWRDDFESNYEQVFDEYYRIWRAQWAKEDQERSSERSKIISPATQQAVESSVAEVEEATFGRGKWFDIEGDIKDPNIQNVREKLQTDFDEQQIRKDISECLLNAAVFGTGIGEVVIESVKERRPATRPMSPGLQEIGVELVDRFVVRLNPVMPQNFLIDPVATDINDSIGVIIDEYVPRHSVELLQEQGVYKSEYVEDAPTDTNIEPDEQLSVFPEEKVRLTKYYGLVPTELLREYSEVSDDAGMYVEAVVVLANDGVLLKAIESPYMMQDRPVVAFPWDIVPNRFWGRGVCEKGYMSQKALDTEMRARIDALALTTHPMMAMDVSRLPAGTKPVIRPGKTIFTNGPPAETLMPFKFGNLDQNTFTQAQALQSMVQQATGAVDTTGLLSSVSGETKAGAVSMSLGAVIKRHKRTLINFQEAFLLPFVRMAAYRYMQFDPERYPSSNFKFKPSSTLGIVAREYEVSQLITLLQTMSADSPLYPALVQSIVENMNLSNREELMMVLQEAGKPSEQQQAMQAEQTKQMQLQNEQLKKQNEYIGAQAEESQARAEKYTVEADVAPINARANLYRSVLGDLQDDGEQQDFENRLAVMDRVLQKEDLDIRRSAVKSQEGAMDANSQGSGTVQQSVPESGTNDQGSGLPAG